MTFDYALSEVQVTAQADLPPGSFVLCQAHLDRYTVPKGWRITADALPGAVPLSDAAVEQLADRVRRAGGVGDEGEPRGTEHSLSRRTNLVMLASRAHLRVVADAASYPASRVA